MELRAGYKNTEVGVIPNDWEVKKLGDILKVIGGGAFKSSDSTQTGVKWLKIANVGINQAVWDDESYLPKELIKDNENFLLKENDYVLALTRPILDRKLKIAKLNKNDVPALLNQRVGKIEVENQIDIDFAYFLFQKYGTINGLLQSMAGTDPPNLSNKGIYSIDCVIPPTKAEQTAIATALSNADALISSLEKLIAKKRNIKQGAMQTLLQPKEGWEVKKLGEVFTFYPTANYSKAEMAFDGEIGCLHYGLIHAISNTNYSFDNGVKYYVIGNKSEYEAIKDGDVIMVDASEDLVGINKSIEVFGVGNRKFIAGLHTYLMRDENSVFVNKFRGLVLNSNGIKKQLLKLAVGMKVFGVSKVQLKEVLMPIPPLNEQTRIATILSDMDNEITALETKLEKYRKVKLGMMQNLLTGKIRVI